MDFLSKLGSISCINVGNALISALFYKGGFVEVVAIEVVGVVGIGGPCGADHAAILGILQVVKSIIGKAIAHDFTRVGDLPLLRIFL